MVTSVRERDSCCATGWEDKKFRRIDSQSKLGGGPGFAFPALALSSTDFYFVTFSAIVDVFVCPPPVALTVIVEELTPALPVAVIVRFADCPGSMLAAENFTVTPAGMPLAVSVSGTEKPYWAAEESLITVDPVIRIDAVAALAERVNVGAGVTVSVKGAVAVSPPPLAVTTTFTDTSAAVLEALSLMETEPVPGAAIEAGVITAETPLGKPVKTRFTALLNPPVPVVVRTSVVLAPRARERLEALAVAVREGTLSVHCTLLLIAPAVAAMFTT
jgi:hypothetical protein